MWGRLAAKVAVYLMRHARTDEETRSMLFAEVVDLMKNKLLTNEERQILTALFLDRLGALPLHARITVDKTGRVFVNNRSLNLEEGQRLRDAATAMLNNAARKLVREAVIYMVMAEGTIKSVNADMMLFGKAALYFLQQEDELYNTLAIEGLNDE